VEGGDGWTLVANGGPALEVLLAFLVTYAWR
jgi:hypothetical protein